MKKIISILLIICISIPLLAITVSADIYSSKFVVLGDSIAYGYALENKDIQRYSTLVGKQIGAEVFNHAVNGMKSEELILALNSGAYDESLNGAKYVSVSIGSNDLLQPFANILSDVLSEIDVNLSNISAIVKDQSMITDVFTKLNDELTNNEILLQACEKFKDKLSTIVGVLKKKSPDAEIYFNNIYNPYAGVVITNPLTGDELIDFNKLGEFYIKKINANFDKKSYNYTLIDLYTPFNAGNLTNVSMSMLDMTSFSIDPHPNAAGHKVIADTLLNVIGVMPRPVDIEGHWGEPYIMAMIHKGLFSELINNNFYPDSPMPRGMFVTVLGRLLEVDVSKYKTSTFSDVAVSDYYSPYVAWASGNKIILGTGDNKFEPELPITREEMAVILQRCITNFKIPITSGATTGKFNDAAVISSWAVDAIALMQSAELLKGDENNNVSPQNTITNAEVVTILYRFDDSMKNAG